MHSLLILAALATPADDAEAERFFEARVRPLLAKHCQECHSGADPDGGLAMTGLAALLAGGESGPAVEPGDVHGSLLIEAVRYESYEMPPEGKLPDADIAVLEKWVAGGAVWPGGGEAVRKTEKITDEDRAYWSFQPVADPPVPDINGSTAIDKFLNAKLADCGLQSAPPADRRTLVRRLYQTVIGLPPTPEQVDAFLADDSPNAYERLVEELLASPRHGEHAATPWLDLVRYAESDGYKADHNRPEAWRYRDWVIGAINADMPFDEFARLQLAGDELRPGDPDALVATGYLRLPIYEYNQRDVRTHRQTMLADITDTTGDAFLGMGMGCARCHDHKFDPILQRDYFRLQAFFANLSFAPTRPLHADADFEQRLGEWRRKAAEPLAGIEKILAPKRAKLREGALSKFTEELRGIYEKADRTPDEQQIADLIHEQVIEQEGQARKRLSEKEKQRIAELDAKVEELAGPKPTLAMARAASEVGDTAPVVFIPGKQRLGGIEPGFLSVLDRSPGGLNAAPVAIIPEVPHTTGRRAALATWLTRDDHPLTPRVIVNRVWQQCFGAGLVATPSDFGHLGEPPSHPELLDHLTRRFVDGGWSLKRLRRAILLSDAFRRSASAPPEAAAIDPDNRLLSHFRARRLTAEQIRDSMLSVSGELDPAAGGPPVSGHTPRRSVYVRVRRNAPDPVLAAFDMPDRITSAGRRNVTTTPTQALLLMNNRWATGRAVAMARRVGSSDDPVAEAVRRAFGRGPAGAERRDLDAFLEAYTLPPLCHALMNSNEFLFVE